MSTMIKAQSICTSCDLSRFCLPIGLNKTEQQAVNQIVTQTQLLHKNDILFRENKFFKNLFIVKSGFLKTVNCLQYKKEQITAFYLPGEILGLDGIANQIYVSSAIALQTTAVCHISFDQLLKLACHSTPLQQHLMRLVSHKLAPCTIGKNDSAEERMAAFLLNLSTRFSRGGASKTCFNLPMSREDIGNYLGIATETVSRILKRLQNENLIQISRRDIEIKNLRRLQTLTHLSSFA